MDDELREVARQRAAVKREHVVRNLQTMPAHELFMAGESLLASATALVDEGEDARDAEMVALGAAKASVALGWMEAARWRRDLRVTDR